MSLDHTEKHSQPSRTILVVDDNVTNLRVISQYLKESGHRVLTSKDGKSALAKAQIGKPDLILLDVMMPGIDGFETCRRLKADQELKKIPVIFMTALTGIEEKIKAFKLGAVDYVTKPFQAEEMLVRVHNHLRLRELTDRLEAQTIELAAAKELAETANAYKSDFLARMSHEIRTPLNAVTGLTHILLHSDLTQDQRENLNKIQLASDSLLGVINDILDFSKVEAGLLELSHAPFDLDQVIDYHTNLFIDRVEQRDIKLLFSVSPEVPRKLVGDAGRLTQLLTNLIGNAIKFTEAGEISINVELGDSSSNEQDQASLKFSIRDTGIGISKKALQTLFDPFTQGDDTLTQKHQGSGLGLAICKQLVELMDGRIWVESTPGQGSIFFFTASLGIPKTQQNGILLEDTQERVQKEPQTLTGKKVLVVEDSDLNREVVTALLEELGLVVETAENGSVGVEKVSSSPEDRYDVVLMDIQMPVMDGYEATRKIREWETEGENTRQRIPIIALTGHAMKGDREKYLAADMDDYLPKPINFLELQQILLKWTSLSPANQGTASELSQTHRDAHTPSSQHQNQKSNSLEIKQSPR